MTPAPVAVAVDVPGPGGPRRAYLLCEGDGARPLPVDARFDELLLVVYPTRTYCEGLGQSEPSALSPEDRRLIRSLRRRCRSLSCVRAAAPGGAPAGAAAAASLISFDLAYLRRARGILQECMTRPNRQDYLYLATKTFGLNLAVRAAFMAKSVLGGQLPLFRALVSTGWYQLQDAVFTIFGQTYMKFLGRMTGMLRIGTAYVGDFLFVYVQLVAFEFLNRLVLGPLGENPLVYTWSGFGLILLNIMQGMVSGGPLIPAINKLRKVGLISHSTMMHLYQLSSLTMQFGLFATFGYQRFYALLTAVVLIVAWTSYVLATVGFRDPELPALDDAALGARLEDAVSLALSRAAAA